MFNCQQVHFRVDVYMRLSGPKLFVGSKLLPMLLALFFASAGGLSFLDSLSGSASVLGV